MGNVLGGGGGGFLSAIGSIVGTVFGGPIGAMIGQMIGGMLDQALGNAMQDNGVSADTQDQAHAAARDAFNRTSGGLDMPQTGRGSLQDGVKQFADATNASPADRGRLQDLADQLQKLINDAIAKGTADAAGGEGTEAKNNKKEGSWIVALARALGATAGKSAANLVQLSDKLQKAGDDKIAAAGGKDEKAKESAAVAYNEANVEFQGASQEFNMLMTTISTTLKSLGEAMSQVARKQ